MSRKLISAVAAGLFGLSMAAGLSAPAMAGPKHCPPGLANKGCVPPGLAKKGYTIGQPLPAGTRVVYVPEDQRDRFPRPPEGHIYGYVDGDLLLIAEATKRVVDAVVAVDAATRGTRDD
jgi:hypothetical protein